MFMFATRPLDVTSARCLASSRAIASLSCDVHRSQPCPTPAMTHAHYLYRDYRGGGAYTAGPALSGPQPARVVSYKKLVLSGSSFYKVEKRLGRLARRWLESLRVWFERNTVCADAFWACAVQYKVIGDGVMTMNIIKNANFRAFLFSLSNRKLLPDLD